MKKITLLLSLAFAVFLSANAVVTLPTTGTLAPAIPTDWTYVSNDPTNYPNPSFYSTVAGLKLNFENMGVISPEFNEQAAVSVTLNIVQLNANTKTAAASTNIFTITGLNSTGAVVATAYLTAVSVSNNLSVNLTGTGIVKVKVIMTGYPNNGTAYCNVNLASVSIAARAAGLNNLKDSKLEAFVSGKNLVVTNVADGSEVEIFSAVGSKVQTSVLTNGKVSIANLKGGMYVVRSGKLTQKIML